MVNLAIEKRFILLWATILFGIVGVLVYREMPVELLPQSPDRHLAVLVMNGPGEPKQEAEVLQEAVSAGLSDLGLSGEILAEARFESVRMTVSVQTDLDGLANKLEVALMRRLSSFVKPRMIRVLELGNESFPSMELAILPRQAIPMERVSEIAREFSSHLSGLEPVARVEIRGLPEPLIRVVSKVDSGKRGESIADRLQLLAEDATSSYGGHYGGNKRYQWQKSGFGEDFDFSLIPGPSQEVISLDGSPVVMVSVYRSQNTDDLRLSEAVRGAMSSFSENMTDISIVSESARYISEAEENVMGNLIIGTCLACVCILLFIRRFWATALVSLSIPIALILSVPVLHILGISRNVMSLAGAALGVGIVVDATLSTLGAFNERMSAGYLPAQAAKFAARTNQIPLLVTSLSTLAVFVPILFLDGLVGSLFWDLSLTVITGQVIGFFVSVYLMPGVACLLHDKKQTHLYVNKEEHKSGSVESGALLEYLRRFLMSRERMTLFNGALFALVAFSIAVAPPGEFLPAGSSDQFETRVEFSGEVPDEERTKISEGIDQMLQREGFIKRLMRVSDQSIVVSASGFVDLDLDLLNREVRHIAYPHTGGLYRVNSLDAGSRQGDDVELFVPADLSIETYREFGTEIDRLPGVVGIKQTWDDKRSVVIDSIEHSSVYASWIPESKTPRVHRLLQEPTVLGFAKPSALQSILPHFSYRDRRVTSDLLMVHQPLLSSRYEIAPGLEIDPEIFSESQELAQMQSVSYRVDGRNYHRLSVDIDSAPSGLIEGRILEIAKKHDLDLKWHPRSAENRRGFINLLLCLATALIIIALIVFGQMRSVGLTAVTMCTFLWAPIGSVLGLLVHSESLSASALVGFILLAGTIVNNGILLVDRIEKYRKAQLDPVAACVEAARDRALPVIITSLTTVLGSLPLVFESGAGSQMYRGLAIVLVYGTLISTPLSLLGVPSLVVLVGVVKERLMRLHLRTLFMLLPLLSRERRPL